MIRAEARSGSSLGKLAADYTRRGELLPAELIARVMAGTMGTYVLLCTWRFESIGPDH